jgi:hypothetical protein
VKKVIQFTNIRIIDGWVYAHAKNLDTGEEVDAKATMDLTKNEFEISSGETCGYFVKGLGSLRIDLCKLKGKKIPEKITIEWGY